MSRLIYIILLACACCVVMSACGRIDDMDSNTETRTLYGVTEEKLFEIGAKFYTDVAENLPEEYMISEKIRIDSQKETPRCMAYATAMVLRYLGDDISGDEVYYEINRKDDNGGIYTEAVAVWINKQGKYNAQLYMGTLENLKTSLNKGVPVIVSGSASPDSYAPHAFLVTGYDKEYVYIADSAINETHDYYNRKVTYEEFESMWDPEDEDGLYHHLFIEVSLSGNGASDDSVTIEEGAFETLGVKEYEAVSLDGIDIEIYKPVDITEEYIVLTSTEETEKEHFLSLEFYLYMIETGEMVKIDGSVEYLEVLEPSIAKVNGNYIAGVIQHNSENTSVLNYYLINPGDRTIAKLQIEGEPASNVLFSWNQSDIISLYNNKVVAFDLGNNSKSNIVDYSDKFDEIYIETMAVYKDHAYVVEAYRKDGVNYADIGQLDRVLREYDEDGNVLSEFQLKPIVDTVNITSAIKKIIVGEKYVLLEDENEHVVFLKKTETGYELDSALLQNPKHYVQCLDNEDDLVCLKSSVDGSCYLFDMSNGDMYDLEFDVDGAENLVMGNGNMLLLSGEKLYVVQIK